MSKFCIRLKELRISRDLSQQKLADIVGISKSSINMYERGEREPGLELLETFADYFNVDMDYLLGKCDIPRKNLLINSVNENKPGEPELEENMIVYHRDGKTSEIKLPPKKMDLIVQMINEFKDKDPNPDL